MLVSEPPRRGNYVFQRISLPGQNPKYATGGVRYEIEQPLGVKL